MNAGAGERERGDLMVRSIGGMQPAYADIMVHFNMSSELIVWAYSAHGHC